MHLSELFEVNVSAVELIVRGTIIFWFLFLVFRLVLRRDTGGLGVADVLFVAIVADAAQNGMAGEYTTISEGLILLSTIIFWNTAIDYVAFRFPVFRFLTEPAPLLLVKDGRFVQRNLRREFLTQAEVMSSIREHGILHLSEVHRAYLESSGSISVVKRERDDKDG